MSNIIHGRNLVITDENDTAIIACAKTCEISKDTEMLETCSSNSGDYNEYYPGRSSWMVTVGFFVTAVGTVLYENQQVTLKCNGTLLGTAYIKQCRITGTVGNLSQGSIAFQGTGPIGDITPPSE